MKKTVRVFLVLTVIFGTCFISYAGIYRHYQGRSTISADNAESNALSKCNSVAYNCYISTYGHCVKWEDNDTDNDCLVWHALARGETDD